MIAALDLNDIGAGAPVVVSVDALHTHRATAAAVIAAGAHYVMTVKANQPRLRAAVIAALDVNVGASHRSADRGHGRTEERYLRATPAAGINFPGAAQVMRVVRYRGELAAHGQGDRPRHHLSAARTRSGLAALIRGHWAIETPSTTCATSPSPRLPGRTAQVP